MTEVLTWGIYFAPDYDIDVEKAKEETQAKLDKLAMEMGLDD